MKILTKLFNPVKEDRSTQVLILANIVSLLMAIIYEWDVFQLLFLYWAETAIIGFFAIVKMIHSIQKMTFPFAGVKLFMLLFLVGFFILHFGGFMMGHFLFIYAFFGNSGKFIPDMAEIIPFMPKQIDVLGVLLGCAILFCSHAFSFWHNYILKKEYLVKNAMDYFSSPYARIMVMHITIIFGGVLAMLLNVYFALILLSVLKIITDVYAHQKAHAM